MSSSCSSISKCDAWTEHGAKQAIIQLLLDDAKGNIGRPALPENLWKLIARFLRFPSPMQMVYLFGGRRRGHRGEECLDTAEVFDWWCGDWVPLPPMSSARVGAAATGLDDLVVVAGGYYERATSPLNTVEAYDPFSREWRLLPPMLTCRYGLSLVNVNGKVFAIGGDDGQRVCTANEVYDPAQECWRKAAPLPTPLAGGKAEAHAGKIYYVGGCDDNEELSDAAYVYCPDMDRWSHACRPGSTSRLSLSVGRTSFAMAFLPDTPSADTGSAHLVVTGGVSARTDEYFLTTTEMLPLGRGNDTTDDPDRVESLQGGSSSSDTSPFSANKGTDLPPNSGGRSWADRATVKPIPQPRSGCRSIVLWRSPQQRFFPWVLDGDARRAQPYVVVLGGETPCLEEGMVMRPSDEPVILDVAKGEWHWSARDASDDKQDSHSNATDIEVERQRQFLKMVGRLRTNRVAFAITVAKGMPSQAIPRATAAHGG